MTLATYTSERLGDFSFAHSLEWIETNGLGGYASSTVSGANSRRYHGMLVASMHPPVERRVMLSKLEETIVRDGTRTSLSANQYPGTIYPNGYQHIISFERKLFPVFKFRVEDVVIQKTIAAVHGENTTLVLYEVLEASEPFNLELLPLCACKDFHSNARANDSMYKGFVFDRGQFRTKNYEGCPELFISVPGSTFTPTQNWYYNFEYSIEQYRGLDFTEDLFNHGTFNVKLTAGDKLGVIISTEDTHNKNAFQLFEKEKLRRENISAKYQRDPLARLALAADQFIVARGSNHKTVIAGYPWFSDWGRDTMIALPGLCLVTGRFDDARAIIKAFSESVSHGMLPNRFPDFGEAPEYNTVDATLWYFMAIYKYFLYTKDSEFLKSLMPVLADVIEWHDRGTRYNIHVDQDGLLYAGEDHVQLTWMDAKVGDWVVTPRKGKAVEINALWFNALSIMAEFYGSFGNKARNAYFKERAAKVKHSFNEIFWNSELQCLYDFIDGTSKNQDIRPNQIYAVGLPFPIISKDRAQSVFNIVSEKLLTTWGLRSLNAENKEYKPHYGGDPWHRDSAYHQGTTWSYLLGIYIDALIYLEGNDGRSKAKSIIRTFYNHLDEAAIGTVSEIFDADMPHTPRGCFAQAWSVAEILRVALEYQLETETDTTRKKDKIIA
jgi:predicted glycogen debranching enzyme